MRNVLISFPIVLLIFYVIMGLIEVDKKTTEWNNFLEENNCVKLKTSPSLHRNHCYVCDDAITYCR